MPPVNFLIKSDSSARDMACISCFYRDVAQNRENAFEGMLTLGTMEKLIRVIVDSAERYAKPGAKLHNTIQTNGYQLDEARAGFLAEERFLVGLSLEGPVELYNLNRKTHQHRLAPISICSGICTPLFL